MGTIIVLILIGLFAQWFLVYYAAKMAVRDVINEIKPEKREGSIIIDAEDTP